LPLKGSYVRSLQTLRASGDLEFNRLTFVQRFIPLRLNRGEMDENVLAGLALDKSKSLAGIEPLHCSLFFQLCFSFLFELFGAVIHRLQAKKEGCKCGLAAPSTILKVLQEQQTQHYLLMLSLRCPFNWGGSRDTPTGYRKFATNDVRTCRGQIGITAIFSACIAVLFPVSLSHTAIT